MYINSDALNLSFFISFTEEISQTYNVFEYYNVHSGYEMDQTTQDEISYEIRTDIGQLMGETNFIELKI